LGLQRPIKVQVQRAFVNFGLYNADGIGMKKLIFILSIVVIMSSAQFVFANPGKQAKPKNKSMRSPSQEIVSDYVEEALQAPHNCRVVIHYVYFSETEKVEILPFKVKSEDECKDTAKLYRPVLDKKIKAKNVNHVWINVELP